MSLARTSLLVALVLVLLPGFPRFGLCCCHGVQCIEPCRSHAQHYSEVVSLRGLCGLTSYSGFVDIQAKGLLELVSLWLWSSPA